jgi:hypothetical protein
MNKAATAKITAVIFVFSYVYRLLDI